MVSISVHVVAKFSVEEATAGYCRAIDAFRRTRVDDLFLVTLIEDFACFLVQCGHTERAVAIFQVGTELCPAAVYLLNLTVYEL